MEIYELLTGYEKFASINHSDHWEEVIKKSIEKYGQEKTIEGRNVFYKRGTNDEMIFWRDIKEIQKKKDLFYDKKKFFYEENLIEVSLYTDIKDWFFSLDYKVVNYMYYNYTTYIKNQRKDIKLCLKKEIKSYLRESEYEYQAKIYETIHAFYKKGYKEFYGFALEGYEEEEE